MEWNNKISENVQAVPFSGIRKFFDLAEHNERCYFFRCGRTRLCGT